MLREKKQERFETIFGVSLSLLIGFGWILGLHIKLLILPLMAATIVSNIMILVYVEKIRSSVLSLLAVNAITIAVIFKILEEIYRFDRDSYFPKFMFFLEIIYLTIILVDNMELKKFIFLAFHKFRLFKIFKTKDNGKDYKIR